MLLSNVDFLWCKNDVMMVWENLLVLGRCELNYFGLNCQVVWSLVLFYYPSSLLIFLTWLYSYLLTYSTHTYLPHLPTSLIPKSVSLTQSSALSSRSAECLSTWHSHLNVPSASHTHYIQSQTHLSSYQQPPPQKAPAPFSVFSSLMNVKLTKPETSLFLAQYLTNYPILCTS